MHHNTTLPFLICCVNMILQAYVGFLYPPSIPPVAVATGKWGCGAFNGDPQLKTIIQLLAASHAGRDIALFTFEDLTCLNDILSIYESIREMKISKKAYVVFWIISIRYNHSLSVFGNFTFIENFYVSNYQCEQRKSGIYCVNITAYAARVARSIGV